MADRYLWDEIGERTIIKGFHGKFIHSERMTFVLWRFEAGAVLPPHQHPHEQVAHVLEGELELIVEGQRFHCGPGSVLVIPANARHEGTILTDARVMDVFAPVREDYRDGSTATVLGDASQS